MSTASKTPNFVRFGWYRKDNGGDPFKELTPAQRRRFQKHHRRTLGESGPGKVTSKQTPSRPNNPLRRKRRG